MSATDRGTSSGLIHSDQALQYLVAGTASVSGERFFAALVEHLARALGVRMAVVTECVQGSLEHVRQLARWKDGEQGSGLEYHTANTPCSEVLESGEMCYYPDRVRDRFSTDPFLSAFGAVCYLGVPLFGTDGSTLGHLFIVHDATLPDPGWAKSVMGIFAARAAMELQRKLDEARIREQATFLDNANDAILIQDMGGVIRYWNKGAERLYGWSAAEAVGRRAADLPLEEGDRRSLEDPQAHPRGPGDWSGELHQRTKTGKPLVVRSSHTLVSDVQGRPSSTLIINTDATETKELERSLLRAQRIESLGTLASGLAHDLNNVLTPILLAVETLLAKPSDAITRELLMMIEANAKRGADTANRVLTFARGSDGGKALIDPWNLIREVEGIIRATFPPAILLRTHMQEEPWHVLGNATELHQVLLNLCVNARDAMPDGGILTISIEHIESGTPHASMPHGLAPGRYVLITVEDTGTGIAPEILDRMFEPFFTTKRAGKGTGLGLATASGIVRSHGGAITVSSEAGQGAAFRIFLPAGGNPVPAKGSPARSVLRGRNELILVVDDEASIRQMTRMTLENHGYRVLTANDGTEALSLYARFADEIGLVLTDMTMPHLDGTSTIRALVRMNAGVRIIASSGTRQSSDDSLAFPDKALVRLSKPYTAESLLTSVHNVLNDTQRSNP